MDEHRNGAELYARGEDYPSDDYVNVDELGRIIGRRKYTFFGVLAAGLVMLGILLAAQSESYRARTTLVVNPTVAEDETAASAATPLTAYEEIRVATVLEILRARETQEALAIKYRPEIDLVDEAPVGLVDVVKNVFGWSRPNASSRQSASFTSADSGLPINEQTTAVRKMVAVERAGESRLIHINVHAQSPEAAVSLANGLPQVYLDMRRSDREHKMSRRVDRLRDQFAAAGTELYEAELAVARYMRDNDLLVPQATSAIEARISSVESALSNAKNESVTRRLSQLRDELDELQDKLASLSLVYGEGYPEIIETKSKIEEVEAEIAFEESNVKTTMQARRSDLDASAAALSSELRSIRGRHFQALEAGAGLRELERQVEARSAAFSSLSDRLRQAEYMSRADDEEISVFSHADVGLVARDNGTGRLVAVGVFGIVMLAGLTSFIVEGFDQSVRTRRQVSKLLNAPTVAMIPDTRRIFARGQDVEKFLSRRPANRFALSIRNLFLEIMSKSWDGHPRIVVISSLGNSKEPGVLTTALAHVSKEFECEPRVLKIGGPSNEGSESSVELVHTGLQWNRTGETEKEASATLPTSLVVRSDMSDQEVADPKRAQEFEDLVNGADLVIIETPSVFETRDAKALAAYASDVILVVEWGKTSPSALRAARELFRNQTNLSAVISRVNWRAHARRNYGDEIEFSLR